MPFSFLAAAQALPLPPKLEEKTYKWVPDLKSLEARRAIGVEVVTREPQLNGGVYYSAAAKKLYVLSTDFKSVKIYPLADTPLRAPPTPAERPLSSPNAWEKEFFRDNVLGRDRGASFRGGPYHFRREGASIHLLSGPKGTNIWSIELGFDPLGLESEANKGLTAWTPFPPKLFFLPQNFAQAYRYTWDEQSEPVRFWECDRNRLVLVENLPNKYSRFVFFRHPQGPASYTILDLSENGTSRSEVSGVISLRGCEDFVISGVFGIVRVRYPARF